MCGICGVYEFGSQRQVSRDLIHRMNETLVHRGPDDGGVFASAGIGIGHRRLSIIDLAGGHQPISNEDGTVWVILNGEIYNYGELRNELLSRGHRFATQSDTEAIVHLYEEVGEQCFERLRGMFTVAIWDSRRKKLVLARDRVGKKPLFYTTDSRRLVFGSELKAILAAGGLDLSIDNEALTDYFSFGYIPAPKTIYRQVRKVMPGHYLVATPDSVYERQYWDLSFAHVEERSEEQWRQLIEEAVDEATRIRLMSDVPLGAFLSGGVDSSAVVASMSRTMDRAVTTCSIGFEEDAYDEAAYAREISRHFSTDHYEETVRPDALSILSKLAWHYDEPFADSSAIPTYYVSQVARKRVTVALGGDGGDENFAGYRRYLFDRFENQVRSLVPSWIRGPVCAPLGQLYPPLAWAPRVFRAKATLQSLARTPLQGYFNSISIFRPDEKSRLLSDDFLDSTRGYDSINVLQNYYDRADTSDPLSRIQYIDIKTYLTDDILTKVDRASMAVSLEVRAPLLDHKLMELVARIPSGLKLKGQSGKYIFKKALEPRLPKGILQRRKQGFAIPLADWFRADLRDLAHEALFANDDGILNRSYLRTIWKEHQSGVYDRSAHLWAALMFREWQKTFSAAERLVGVGAGAE